MPSHRTSRPPVVTISAPYGAGGSVVGPGLAERLGVEFVDRAIPVAVAERLQIPVDDAIDHEAIPRDTFTRLMSSFAPAVGLFGGTPVAPLPPHDDDEFRTATEQVLREHAARGAVILGRAAAIVQRDVPGAFHVRLTGSRANRVRQAMARGSIDAEQAEKELELSDLAREAYVRELYRCEPADPDHYHLVLDSTRLDLDCCVELICTAISRSRPD